MSELTSATAENRSEMKPAAPALTLVGSEEVIVCVGDSCYLPSATPPSPAA